MKAYRLSVNLKLGLIVFAVLIAVTSLAYTNRLVHKMREREKAIIQLWATALEQVNKAAQQQSYNPYLPELRALETYLRQPAEEPGLSQEEVDAYRRALTWAQGMPPASELTFIMEAILEPNAFGIPAVLIDSSTGQPAIWRNVPGIADSLTGDTVEEIDRIMRSLLAWSAENAEDTIRIEIDFGDQVFRQYVHYGESNLVKELRLFPYIQLLFVSLFILVGYLGFSYVRRSEQSSLWVGMAKEAAHQLGTPISSLMGWLELLRMQDLPGAQVSLALDDIENDITRLRRVANRFSDIGSLPKLEVIPLAPVIENIVEYMRRRIPQKGKKVTLTTTVPPEIKGALNAELFEWVIENLLKNALDALESEEGQITLTASTEHGRILIEVQDTGKGIDRRNWKNVFRPGYSTKKRGWGLGLSLAKRIVEDYHGGTLTLTQSRPGHGSTFRIDLPVRS